MKSMDVLAAVLLVVGGVNWGLVGAADFDLVAAITGDQFGQTNVFSRVLYLLVAAAAIYQVVSLKSIWRRWGVKTALAA